MATLNKPYTAEQIKSAIGASGNVVDKYFNGTDGSINAYSPIKPVRNSSQFDSGETFMELQNYGFSTTYLMNQGVNNIFNYAKSYSWVSQYLRPRGSGNNEWYRWDDFNGYEAGAVAPYNYRNIPNSLSTGSWPLVYSMKFERQTPSINISKMGVVYYNGGASAWKWGVAYRHSGTTGASFAYGGSVASTTGDVYIDVSFPSVGTYECVFMACVGGDGNPMLWMPNGYFTISVSQSTTPIIATLTSSINPWISDNYIVGFGIMGFDMKAQSAFVVSSTGAVELTFTCFNSSGDQRAIFTVIDTNQVLSYSGTAVKSQTIDWMYGSSIDVYRYIDSGEWEKISYIDVRMSIIGQSGSGTWSTDKIYSWKIYK